MIEYTKCPDCFANYMGDHTCDPLMKFLVSEYKNKIEKNKIDMMKTQHEAGGECICEAIFHENIKTASPKCTLHGNSAMKDERYKDFGDALAFSLIENELSTLKDTNI